MESLKSSIFMILRKLAPALGRSADSNRRHACARPMTSKVRAREVLSQGVVDERRAHSGEVVADDEVEVGEVDVACAADASFAVDEDVLCRLQAECPKPSLL